MKDLSEINIGFFESFLMYKVGNILKSQILKYRQKLYFMDALEDEFSKLTLLSDVVIAITVGIRNLSYIVLDYKNKNAIRSY